MIAAVAQAEPPVGSWRVAPGAAKDDEVAEATAGRIERGAHGVSLVPTLTRGQLHAAVVRWCTAPALSVDIVMLRAQASNRGLRLEPQRKPKPLGTGSGSLDPPLPYR